ncbi:hypothetical protein B0H21DRAFT_769071 [Amylocystis lapponica]|nr:hypothetical protein B0H21DRAFT_769071 [Amylocystis lapponica]
MAILQGDWQDDWESTWAVRTHTNTNEEEVIELSQDFLLATTVNSTRVDSRKVCYLPKKKKRATHSSRRLQSSETPLCSPTSCDRDPKHRPRSGGSSIPSTLSWMDRPRNPVDSAAESTAIHFDAETADAPVCIDVEACFLEVKKMEWRRHWRAFIRQRTQRRLEARDDLRRGLIAIF